MSLPTLLGYGGIWRRRRMKRFSVIGDENVISTSAEERHDDAQRQSPLHVRHPEGS